MFYQCFDCHKDIISYNNEHYEVHFIEGKGNKHQKIKEITVCKECYTKKRRSNERNK